MDLRKRILTAYDRGDATRDQIARRFDVSLGMVKKLIHQRRHTGCVEPRHRNSGRKPKILDSHKHEMKALLREKSDLTLEELRTKLGLDCTVQAIHYALADMGMTYKKRRSVTTSNPEPMSHRHGGSGGADKVA